MKKTKNLRGNLSHPNQLKNLPKIRLRHFNCLNQVARKHKRKMKMLAMKNNKKAKKKKLVFLEIDLIEHTKLLEDITKKIFF